MTDKQINKALKDNEKPFGLMSEEMQEKAQEIGKQDFEYYSIGRGGEWIRLTAHEGFIVKDTYRLRPDYKEEPEVVKCEVYFADSGELEYRNTNKTGSWLLADAPNDPDFIGFLYRDDIISAAARLYDCKEESCIHNTMPLFGDFKVLTPTHVLFKGKQ